MELTHIRKFFRLLDRGARLVSRELFLYLPFIILFHVAYTYTYKTLVNPMAPEQYKVLFGAIGITATLAGLSFRASTTCSDAHKKEGFYVAGERMFHATLLFTVATIMRYSMEAIDDSAIYGQAKTTLHVIVMLSSFLFFYYGTIYVSLAAARLHIIMFRGNETPLD